MFNGSTFLHIPFILHNTYVDSVNCCYPDDVYFSLNYGNLLGNRILVIINI